MVEPRLAYGMLGAAAGDPGDRRVLQGPGMSGNVRKGVPGRPSLEEIMASPRVRSALSHPQIEATGHVREGAGGVPGSTVTEVDKSVPSSAKIGGKTIDPRAFVAVHEQAEEEAMHRLMAGGMPAKKAYDIAHTQYALPAERKAVEAAGVPWNKYENKWRGYLSTTEHETGAQSPALDRVQAQVAGGGKGQPRRADDESDGPTPDLAYGMLSTATEDPGAKMVLRGLKAGARAIAPEATSLALGEPRPPIENLPNVPGKVPGVGDPRFERALGELASRGIEFMGPPGAGVAKGVLAAAVAPAARRLARGAARETASTVAPIGTREAAKYLIEPQRELHPGIYKDPRTLAAEAEATVAPEHPALKMLFGVNRQDLYDISQGGTRAGNIDPRTLLNQPANPKGSYTSENIMTPANAQRMVDALAETRTRAPELRRGMIPWYVMDPAYGRLEQISQDPQRLYSRFNTLGSMASPMSDVMTEIRRGTAANQMAELERFPEFERYGGIAQERRFRFRKFPEELEDVPGHTAHSTAQAPSMARYLESGNVEMGSPKVPLYIGASGVPQTGFQTSLPVPDAHFTRAVGMADVRRTAAPGVSMKMPEYTQTGPWFREQVARPSGLEAVPGQALTWGLYSGQTGVDTLIGAPKLELLAKSIYERAQRLGIDPYMLRDKVLLGQEHAELEPGPGSPSAA